MLLAAISVVGALRYLAGGRPRTAWAAGAAAGALALTKSTGGVVATWTIAVVAYGAWERRKRGQRADARRAFLGAAGFIALGSSWYLANVIRFRTLNNDVAPSNVPATAPPSNTPYQDFVIGPVATKPFWQEIDDTTGTSGSGQLISNAFFKPPPPNGMGMSCAQGGENSYAEVTVTSGTLTVEYKDENGNILLDSDGSTPCGPYVLNN